MPVQATQHKHSYYVCPQCCLCIPNQYKCNHAKATQQDLKAEMQAAEGRYWKNRVRGNRLLHPAGRKLNFVELEAIKTGSGGVEGALQSESRQVTTGEYYLLLGVWFKRCVVRHHPLQHSWRLEGRRGSTQTRSTSQRTNPASVLVVFYITITANFTETW